MTVEVKTTVRFQPFEVPEYAQILVDDDTDTYGVKLAELDANALDALAGRWLDNLFASVNRASPFTYNGERAA